MFKRVAVVASMALLAAGLPLTTADGMAGGTESAAAAKASSTEVPADQKVSFVVGVKRSDKQARKALRRVSDPTSPRYRHFPSRKTIGTKYGARPDALRTIRRSAGKHHLSVKLDATGVWAFVTGRAGDMGKWVGAKVLVEAIPTEGGEGAMAFARAAAPKAIRDAITAWQPLDFAYEFPAETQAVQTRRPAKLPNREGLNRGTPSGCITQDPQFAEIVYSPDQLTKAYKVDGLPGSRKVGGAVRAVINAGGSGFTEEGLAMQADCFGLPTLATQRMSVPGLEGNLPQTPQSPEGQLDVETMQSVLPPGSTVTVIESADTDARGYIPFSMAFGLPKRPDVISDSYGLCEQFSVRGEQGTGRDEINIQTSVLLRLALAGITDFDAAGDSGSSDCWSQPPPKLPKYLAVDYDSSVPYVLTIGGSRIVLNRDNTRKSEVTWNDRQLAKEIQGPGGGGGGHSTLFDRPWWQPKSWTGSPMRTTPDLVVHASNQGPAAFVVINDVPPSEQELELQPIGGTSFASPFLAAAFARIAAHERLKGRPPFGQLQPTLYRMFDRHPKAFYDITKGTNDIFNKGCCSAKQGYDAASGLGSPNMTTLWKHLPKPGSASRRHGLG